MKYKVGDKVRIVSEKVGDKWNEEGEMDKWLGKVMTVRGIDSCRYRMEEDITELYGSGWFWHEHMVARLDDEPQNRMADAAALLDLELEEEFNLAERDWNPYKITALGVVDRDGDLVVNALSGLLTGKLMIIRKPFMPEQDETYFLIRANGEINKTTFDETNTYDRAMAMSKNCFRTYASAEANKEAVIKEWNELFK